MDTHLQAMYKIKKNSGSKIFLVNLFSKTNKKWHKQAKEKHNEVKGQKKE
jgi:hypothetical protein